MRRRFKPTREQRHAVRAQLARLQQPATALEIVRSLLPADFKPADVTCTVPSIHPDRFVIQVQVTADDGRERGFALKAYADDFVERVWEYARVLAKHRSPSQHGLCVPVTYVPAERILVFPWVAGRYMSEIVDDRKPQLLRLAAGIAADLHQVDVVPEPQTTVEMFVEEALARSERLCNRWPQTTHLIKPLTDALQEAARFLDPAEPAPVHGDMAAGQFLWTGNRLVLLDLDMFGYTDPAYDVGHFLAQLERRCLLDLTVRAHMHQWLTSFREAYLAAMPTVSPRNVEFYRGLTLVRKIYTICRRQPVEGPALGPQLAARAQAAFEDVLS